MWFIACALIARWCGEGRRGRRQGARQRQNAAPAAARDRVTRAGQQPLAVAMKWGDGWVAEAGRC